MLTTMYKKYLKLKNKVKERVPFDETITFTVVL